MDAQKLEGYDELVDRFLSTVPHDKLASKLTREERLAGLSREEVLLALPDDDLRVLPDTFLATFSDSVRETVRKRLAK